MKPDYVWTQAERVSVRWPRRSTSVLALLETIIPPPWCKCAAHGTDCAASAPPCDVCAAHYVNSAPWRIPALITQALCVLLWGYAGCMRITLSIPPQRPYAADPIHSPGRRSDLHQRLCDAWRFGSLPEPETGPAGQEFPVPQVPGYFAVGD